MSVAVIGAKLTSYLPMLLLTVSVVAAAPVPPPPEKSYLPMLLLTVSVLIGVPLAYRYLRDLREPDDPLRDSDLFADLVQGDAASKMTEAEFRRVRDLLTGAEFGRGTRTRAQPPRSKPQAAAAALDLEQPHLVEPTERPEETKEKNPDTEAKHDPSA